MRCVRTGAPDIAEFHGNTEKRAQRTTTMRLLDA
jgi:hypothetical protein